MKASDAGADPLIERHARMGKHLLAYLLGGLALTALGSALAQMVLVAAGSIVVIVVYWRLIFYILKDLRWRGASPFWLFVPGFDILVWLIWRRSHPIVHPWL